MKKGSTATKNPLTVVQTNIEYGREILQLEANALNKVAKLLDLHFEEAVRVILKMPEEGRVVVSGMGKAGFVAMKISSTFASTGVPSFFLHPAEAVHGDLGRYARGDVALILSNSGETPEVLRIIGHIKRIGCPIIAVTAEPSCSLARHADIVLALGKLEEAGPLGLAPTTSTTAMLALGDALVMSVVKNKDFTKEQFASFHPGGNLGRALTLVSEVMRRDDEHCVVPQSMKCRDVLHRITMTKGRPGAASVIDGNGHLIGVFTDGDLRRCLDQRSDFLELPISNVMTRSPKVIEQNKLVEEALRMMSMHKIDQIIVIDEGKKPVGMVDIQDLVEM